MNRFLVVKLKNPEYNTRLSDRFKILVGVTSIEDVRSPFKDSNFIKVILDDDADVKRVVAIAKFLGGVETIEIREDEEDIA